MWALSIPVPFTKPVGAGAGGFFAPHVRAYIRNSADRIAGGNSPYYGKGRINVARAVGAE